MSWALEVEDLVGMLDLPSGMLPSTLKKHGGPLWLISEHI